MSGIPIHSSDPINSAKETESNGPSPGYPSARPGQSAPAPTRTINASSTGEPPAPQAGAAPAPPATTAKATLPPPPKAGERPLPPEAYRIPGPQQTSAPPVKTAVPWQPVPYPPQMGITVDGPRTAGVPAGSTTSTGIRPNFTPGTDVPSGIGVNLQHPPGYVQNQQATEMSEEQRRVAQQVPSSLGLPGGGGSSSNESGVTAAGIWEGAKTLATQVGQQAEKLHVDIWDRIDGKK